MWFATSSCYFRPHTSENSRQKSLFHVSCQAPRCTRTGNGAVLNVIWTFVHSPRLWVDGDTSLYTVTARNTGETSSLQNKHILVLVICFCSNSTYPDTRSDTFGSQCSPSSMLTPLTPHRFPIAGSSACLFVVKWSDMMRAMGGVGESGTWCRVRGSTGPYTHTYTHTHTHTVVCSINKQHSTPTLVLAFWPRHWWGESSD